MCRVEDIGTLSTKWDVFINPSHQGLGIHIKDEEERLEHPLVTNDSKKTVFS